MPIKPGKNETQSEWMARCTPEMMGQNGGTKRPQAQAVAACITMWNDAKKDVPIIETKAASVNGAGVTFGTSAISSGNVNKSASWSFSASDGNALLGANGDDWSNYSRHFLGTDSSAPENTKGHYKYPFAKGNTVYRSGLVAVRQRAGQQGDTSVFDAAGRMIEAIDGKSAEITRAWSTLEIRRVAEDQRTISGVASTPSTDRMGDIVEPMGLSFDNPIPLLWQHRLDQPVGLATMNKPTANGVTFTAQLAKIDEPGTLRDSVEKAWQSIKAGLIRGVSIGFRSIERSFMDDGGIRFIKAELLELSLVTVPANTDASIHTIKSLDLKVAPDRVRRDMDDMELPEPATGESQSAFMSRCVDRMLNCDDEMGNDEAVAHCTIRWNNRDTEAQPENESARVSSKTMSRTTDRAAPGLRTSNPPGASGSKNVVSLKEAHVKTIQEQIAAFEELRRKKHDRMTELMTAASDAGETLDQAQSEEYDTLSGEIKDIDAHIQRLAALEATNRQRAVAVDGSSSASAERSRALVSGNGSGFVDEVRHVVSVRPNVPKGTIFTRYAMALAAAKGDSFKALQIAKQWQDQTPEVSMMLSHDIPAMMKAAVGAGTTTDAQFASPLIAYTIAASEFIELLRPLTIIGRIPNLRRVPFNIQIPRGVTGSTVNWVGEGAPKPVSNMTFDTVQLRWAKAAGIVILTEELVRFSNPSAETLVRGDMLAAMAQFLDRQFVDPSVAAVTNVSPASITNSVTPVTASGVTAAAFFLDARTMFSQFLAANLQVSGGVWIMTQSQALALSLIQNTLGQNVFPTINAEGGTLMGYPVVTSENIPATGNSPADGFPIIFCLPREIMLADDGQVVIDASNQASVNMDSAPDSPPSGTTILVSLWQANMVGLKAERWINWLKRRPAAASYIQNAKYTG